MIRGLLRRRWRTIVRVALGIAGLVAVAIYVAPFVVTALARRSARACVEQIRAPRGSTLPDCGRFIRDFEYPSSVERSRHEGTYLAEELWARLMMAHYENASVGNPGLAAQTSAAKLVDEAQDTVERGSQRLTFEDLGPLVPAPHLGKMALALGDRRTLLAQYDHIGLWNVRAAILRTALLEGDLPTAETITRRYLHWDPRDADLRTTMAAVLCLGSDPARGLELFQRVPTDRADHRYAAIQRNFGEVLAVMDLCAERAGVDAPTPPPSAAAGIADAEESRLFVEVRLSSTLPSGTPPLLEQAVDRALRRLTEGDLASGSTPRPRRAKLALIGLLLARDPRAGKDGGPLDRLHVASLLAAPKGVEVPPIVVGLSPADVWNEPPGLEPELFGDDATRAEAQLVALADSDTDAARRRLFLGAAARIGLADVARRARLGEPDPSPTRIAQIGAWASAARGDAGPVSSAEIALLTETIAYVSEGGRARVFDGDPPSMSGERETDAAVDARRLVLHALARAERGEDAVAVARSAVTRAEASKRLALVHEARLVALALDRAPPPGPPPIAAGLVPPWIGAADPGARWLTLGGQAVDGEIAALQAAIALPPDASRAFRYALLARRGDLPEFFLPSFLVAQRLLPDATDATAPEVWLDAYGALDLARFSASYTAWSRGRAARLRQDAAAEAAWQKRLDQLRVWKADPQKTEIARFLLL